MIRMGVQFDMKGKNNGLKGTSSGLDTKIYLRAIHSNIGACKSYLYNIKYMMRIYVCSMYNMYIVHCTMYNILKTVQLNTEQQ